MRTVMSDKRVDPFWVQVPFKIHNGDVPQDTIGSQLLGNGREVVA